MSRLQWLHDEKYASDRTEVNSFPDSGYTSIDPAPPCVCRDLPKLSDILSDQKQDLFERYRAMFALRDIGMFLCLKL